MPSIAKHIIDRLIRNGVKHVFGLPGDFSINLFDQLYKSEIEVVPTTTELAAGIAADAYARVNGIGCCCVTYCVGGFRVLDAIAGANAEKSPVIVLAGSPGIKERSGNIRIHHTTGRSANDYECQHHIYEHVTVANTVIRDPNLAGYEIDRVIEACKQRRQPVYIELPRDILDKPLRYDAYTVGTPSAAPSDRQALDEAVAEAAEWLNKSERPVIWAGVEVARYDLGKALIKFAEATNIPICTTVLGKSCVSEKHPLVMGVYCESLADEKLKKIVTESDCLIMLGVIMSDVNLGFLPLRYNKHHALLATSQTVQVRNHTFSDVNFADFTTTLLKSKISRKDLVTTTPKAIPEWKADPETKLTVQRFFQKLATIITAEMAVIADVGESMFGSLDIPVSDCNYISDAFYASMGFAVPAALGVQTARPKIRPIVLVGDGAYQMTGMEFSTLVRRRGLNPIVFVLNNGGYGTERLILDGPYNDIQNWNYEKVPLLVGGGIGFKVTTEGELDCAIQEALETTQPSIINVILDSGDHTLALRRLFGRKT